MIQAYSKSSERFDCFKKLSVLLTSLILSLSSAISTQQFIDFDDHEINYYTGSHVSFYSEYCVKQFKQGTLSCPLKNCDPLVIDTLGSLQFFFTSAIKGGYSWPGRAIQLPSCYDRVIAIRGRDNLNGQRFEAYLGIDSSKFKKVGKSQIFKADLLTLQVKNTQYTDEAKFMLAPSMSYVTGQMIATEVKHHLGDSNNCSWNSASFQKVIKELMPQHAGISINNSSQALSSWIHYWTQNENKLKGIQYDKK